jgi:predicted nucleic acid-binding protein
MIFDTDILIWVQRGNEKAAKLINQTASRFISIQTYMELFQCAQSKKQHHLTRDFIRYFNFQVLPLSENIGHRAAVYIEEYTLSSGLESADAIIAATAVENNLTLSSSNQKHYKSIKDLQLSVFKP